MATVLGQNLNMDFKLKDQVQPHSVYTSIVFHDHLTILVPKTD